MTTSFAALFPQPVQSIPLKKDKLAKSTSQVIWDTILDLHRQEQVATRELLVELTGYKMTIVDDHVSRMIEGGSLRRVRAGVYVPVPRYDPPRPVSASMTTDGFFILEVGEQVLVLQPKEARMVGALMAGQFAQFSNIQSGHDLNLIVNEVQQELRKLKRDLGEG
ncbi:MULTISPECIES: hypothetical protein [unclassified Acidovorax]|uniref:hypothetical protein n=1 Tax=unclassified Acidovorax TaxID=2684926 RepID=UPI0028833556|nr:MULTISPECIES: hypothetical protein [unclassified Acidovorax]